MVRSRDDRPARCIHHYDHPAHRDDYPAADRGTDLAADCSADNAGYDDYLVLRFRFRLHHLVGNVERFDNHHIVRFLHPVGNDNHRIHPEYRTDAGSDDRTHRPGGTGGLIPDVRRRTPIF